MKTILFALLCGTLCVLAQTPPASPDDANGSRDARAREALRRAIAARTNAAALSQPVGGAADTTGALPGAAPIVPAAADNSATNATPVLPPTGRVTPRRADSIIAPTGPANPAASGPGAGPGGPGLITPGMISIAPPAGTTNSPPEEIIPTGTIDFRGADLTQVLEVYAQLVNRTVLRAATLPDPKIILKTQTPLTRREAVQALDAVLGINGIGMVNIGEKFVKADVLASVNTLGAAFSRKDPTSYPEMGPFVNHVVQLKHIRPSEIVQVLQPFAKIPNSILPIDGSQMLVLRDFTENVKRMLELIKEIDVPVPSEFDSEVIPIKYALASEIASALNSLSTGGGGATVGGGTTGTGAGSRGRTTSSGFGRPGGVGSTGVGGSYPGSTTPGVTGQGFGGAAGTPGTGTAGGSFTDRLQNIIRRASVSGDIQVLGQTKMIADERTNSLLIYASKEDMKKIKDIIAKLDVVLAQVLIEAVVIQVTLGDNKNFGISYLQHPKTSGNWTGVGAIGNSFYSPSDFLLSSGSTTGTNGTGNALSGGFNYLASLGQDLDITLTAVASDNRARVLQRPRIQTSHAVQAQLFVGQSRPYPTASYYGGGGYGGYSSIQQLQIGVTLDVTPLINPDGLVVMDIHQTIESYDGDVAIANVGNVPITSRKEAAAKVAVKDRDTIMLGGLIEDDKTKSGSGVPVLMDIPILGYLFRNSSTAKSRTEMIVLIRPTVLPTPAVAALAANSEMQHMPEVRRAQRESKRDERQLQKEDEADDQEFRPQSSRKP